MAVIFALFLVLWAWGRFEIFALRTGHGNGSKIDFLFDAYFGGRRCPRVGRNFETRFPNEKLLTGLQNNYYWQQCESQINKRFYR
jgi:hypothetical protein